jgi:hypothetical protein
VVLHNREHDLVARPEVGAEELATRLIASVTLWVRMISSVLGALRKRRTVSRAFSYLAVAALER